MVFGSIIFIFCCAILFREMIRGSFNEEEIYVVVLLTHRILKLYTLILIRFCNVFIVKLCVAV